MEGTTAGFQNLIMEALGSVIIFLNPVAVSTEPYEYPFYHPTSDRLQPPARRKARGLLSRSCTSGTAGSRLRPNNLDTTDSTSGKAIGGQAPRTKDGPTAPG
jgi:hypothetical protein